jgi:hypothetical protein
MVCHCKSQEAAKSFPRMRSCSSWDGQKLSTQAVATTITSLWTEPRRCGKTLLVLTLSLVQNQAIYRGQEHHRCIKHTKSKHLDERQSMYNNYIRMRLCTYGYACSLLRYTRAPPLRNGSCSPVQFKQYFCFIKYPSVARA